MADKRRRKGRIAIHVAGEPAIESGEKAFLRRFAAAQQQGAQRRGERQRVERGNEHGNGDGHGKLLEERACNARQQQGGQEHRRQHQGDGDDGTGYFLHGGESRLAGREAALHVGFHGFHHNHGVIHHQADGQHHAQEADGIQREAQERKQREGGDDGNRNGDGRNQRGAPALQEDEHHQNHQQEGFHQRVLNFLNGGAHGQRGVQRQVVFHSGGEAAGAVFKALDQGVHRVDGVGAGGGVHGDGARIPAVVFAGYVVSLGTQLHLGDVFQVKKLVPVRTDDDVAEFFSRLKASLGLDAVCEFRSGRGRLRADLAAGNHGVLRLDGGLDFSHGDVLSGHFGGVQPDAHGVAACAEHLHVAHAGNAFHGVHQAHVGIVAQEDGVQAVIRRI